ncbi:MAG: hypothetical protein ILO68_00940 [Clostridia bacterium]|nr:hypothetical protein [Clostridia bacterium]
MTDRKAADGSGTVSPRDCAHCVFYAFDEQTGESFCDCDLDEDELGEWLRTQENGCRYFQLNDEYGTVRKQN